MNGTQLQTSQIAQVKLKLKAKVSRKSSHKRHLTIIFFEWIVLYLK